MKCDLNMKHKHLLLTSMEQFPKNQTEIEKQRAADQKRWEDVAKSENKKRPFLERLTGKNKVGAEEIMIQEAHVDNAIFDVQKKQKEEDERKLQQLRLEMQQNEEFVEIGKEKARSTEFSQETYLAMGKILEAFRTENFKGAGEVYKNLKEGREIIRGEIIDNINKCIEGRNGGKLFAIYREFQKSTDGLSEAEAGEMKSREIVLEKFAKITDENFRDFAVRFVNIGEYRKVIRDGGFREGAEVTIQKPVRFTSSGWVDDYKSSSQESYEYFMKYLNRNLVDFIDDSKINWNDTVENMTNWSHNLKATCSFDGLNFIFKKLLEKMGDNKNAFMLDDKEKNIFLEKFADTLKRLDPMIIGLHLMFEKKDNPKKDIDEETIDDILEKCEGGKTADLVELALSYNNDKSCLDELPGISKFILDEVVLREDFVLLANFLENPNDIKYPDDLKRIVKIIEYHCSYTIPITKKDRNYDSLESTLDHQIMLIIDQSAVGGRSWLYEHETSSPMAGGGNWGEIKKEKIKNKKDIILGALSLIPSEIISQDLNQLASNRWEMSHPIFKTDGTVSTPNTSEIIKSLDL